MNEKGYVLFYGFMIGLTIIVLALALAPTVKEYIDSARNETTTDGYDGLNCTNPDNSNYDKAACIVSDLTIFQFIAGLIFIGGAIITAKIIIG